MKVSFSAAIAISIGIVTLAAYFLQPMLQGLLAVMLGWSILLAAVATLVGILNLIGNHWTRLRKLQPKMGYSLIVILAFFATAGLGVYDYLLHPAQPMLAQVVNNIQLPVEASLMSVLAVSMVYAGVQMFRRRQLNLLSVTFFVSALVFIVMNIGFITSGDMPFMKDLTLAINRLPVAGARGILLGMGLGSLATGLRILMGTDRPYGG